MPITETPFSYLDLNNISNIPPYTNPDKLFTCGFQFGYSDPNINNPGVTASGLMAILNGLYFSNIVSDQIINTPTWAAMFGLPSEQIVFDDCFYCVSDPDTQRLIWVIRGPRGKETLLRNLDSLHAHIAGMIALIDPVNSPYMGDLLLESILDYNIHVDIFNRFKNFNFIDSYQTRASDNLNYQNATSPKDNGLGLYSGNGITKLFVLEDQDIDKWQLSRAGVELKILIDYLNYGGVAVIAPTWKTLLNFKTSLKIPISMQSDVRLAAEALGYPTTGWFNDSSIFCGPLEAVVSLENGGLIERRHTMPGYGTTGSNRVAYACQPYTYKNTGLSAGLLYGLTGSELLNVYANPNEKGSFLSTFMDDQIAGVYKNIPIFHSGFSGTDLSLNQSVENISSMYRYRGLDGFTGLKPESTSSSAGLTTYQLLDDSNYNGLNRLFCVFGKNVSDMSISAIRLFFGNAKTFTMSIPAISDAVGKYAYNKTFKSDLEGGVFSSPLGVVEGSVLNGQIIPHVSFITPNANLLRSQRINFFDFDRFGQFGTRFFLAAEFTGATGANPNAPDRFSTMWLVRTLKEDIINGLAQFSGQVKSQVQTQILTTTNSIITTKYARYLLPESKGGWSVEWTAANNNNPTVVFLRITIKPKVVVLGYTEGPQGIQGFQIDFAISLD